MTFARVLLAFCTVLFADEWPTLRWKEATPEAHGFDSAAFADAVDLVLQKKIPIHSMLVIRHGAVVLDANFYPYAAKVPHDVASVTKSVTSILTGIAIDKGFIKSVDELALPLLKISLPSDMDPRKRRITVGNLLSMTSGLACGDPHVAHTVETELDAMRASADWIKYAVTIPMSMEPGKEFAYCSVNNHLLSAIIKAQTGDTLEVFARKHLFGPLGIKEFLWPVDPQGLNHGWGDLHLYPRDMAKLGYLYLHEGKWGERQIVSSAWVRSSFETRAMVREGVGYGFSWWLNLARTPRIPEAEGRGGQRIAVVPDKDLVVVYSSGGADTDDVSPTLLKALKSDGVLPPNAAGMVRLKRSLATARVGARATAVGKLPAVAAKVSGKRYEFASNALGLRSLSLTFGGGAEAGMEMRFGEELWSGKVGLDGVRRFSAKGHQGQPMAVLGGWRGESEFGLDVDLVSNITHILITLRYSGDAVEAELRDATGSFNGVKVRGVAVGLQ